MTTSPTAPRARAGTSTTPSPPSPRRLQLATSTPDEARDLLVRLFGAHLQVTPCEGTPLQLRMDGVDSGRCSSTEVVLPAHLRYAVGGHGGEENVVISTVTAGRVELERRRSPGGHRSLDRYRLGEIYVGNQPGAAATASTHDVRAAIVTLAPSLLAEAAEQVGAPAHDGPRAGRASQVPAFTTMVPAGHEAARHWRRTTRYVEDALSDPAAGRSPLLVAATGRLLASTALAVFPSTLSTTPTIEDRHDAHPGTVRRAVAFIESNPDVDITTTDIARAAFVSPRAVQLAFRRHLGTTPLAYLRTVRLEQAHRQLQDATPGDGTTVAAVAARWGFTPSRFAEHYRAFHGVLPSRTLRSGGPAGRDLP